MSQAASPPEGMRTQREDTETARLSVLLCPDGRS